MDCGDRMKDPEELEDLLEIMGYQDYIAQERRIIFYYFFQRVVIFRFAILNDIGVYVSVYITVNPYPFLIRQD